MRVYKRGNKWWSSWTEDGVTVRKSTGASTREAATVIAKRWELERADPHHAAASTARFIDESKRFIDAILAREGVPAGTINMYKCKVGHLNRLMPALVRDVDAKAVDAYCEARRDEGASASTIYKEWVALRGVLKSAARRDLWTGQLDILKPSWVSPAGEEKCHRLTWPELRALIDNAPAELADVVRYAVATGARRAELQRAQEGDVQPPGVALLRGSKTESAWKRIPVPPMFRALLPSRAWGAKPNGKLMFRELPENLRCLNAACKSARIAPVTYNDLRRTFASLMLDGGATNTIVAKLLRHRTTAMVDKHYGHHDDAALAALVESQGAVPPVYHREWGQSSQTENVECFLREIVGQDRLELSANGLRDLCGACRSTANRSESTGVVPPVYHDLAVGMAVLLAWDPDEYALALASE